MGGIQERIEVLKQMLTSIDTACLTEFTPEYELASSTDVHVEILAAFMALGKETKNYGNTVNESENAPWLRKNRAPSVYSNSLGMVWISDVWIEGGDIQRIYMLGPVFLDDYSVSHIEKELERMELSIPLKHRFMKYILNLPVVTLNRMFEYGIMLHSCITNEKVRISDYQYPEIGNAGESETVIQPKHGTYAAEQEILGLVEEGNIDYKERLDKYSLAGEIGQLSTGQFLRQEKNAVIIFAALCSRAAIRGGLASELAYSLSDTYLRRVEECDNLSALTLLNREMFHDFVVRVHRLKMEDNRISPQIQRSCDYIGLHLEEKITIHSLAQMLGYSDYYFSNKFKQEIGKTVRDYIMECKISRAKCLLKETVLSVQEIGDLLGYSTQSHFGEVFRKIAGKTPGEYRARSQ